MNNPILIIGGMGPQASLELHGRIIDGAVDRGAANGDDFPEITHISLPIADFINNQQLENAAATINKACRRLYLWRRSARGYCL